MTQQTAPNSDANSWAMRVALYVITALLTIVAYFLQQAHTDAKQIATDLQTIRIEVVKTNAELRASASELTRRVERIENQLSTQTK